MPADRDGAGRFLPCHRLPQWLDSAVADALLDYAIESETRFKPAKVHYQDRGLIEQNVRHTWMLAFLGPFEEVLRAQALNAQPALERALGIKPFETQRVEMELLAYGDGMHFQRHIDTYGVGKTPAGSRRILTLVHYLHRRPRAYSGGAIRLYALDGPQVRDIEPDHNLLVAFPSFAPHSVEPVVCPSGRFADGRFAVTLWLHG